LRGNRDSPCPTRQIEPRYALGNRKDKPTMNGDGQSDSKKVPKKSPNETRKLDEEEMEGNELTKGMEERGNVCQAQNWESMTNKLQLIREKAKADKEMRFTTLMHHVYSVDNLREAYLGIKRDAAPGVDGETWQSYGVNVEARLKDLSDRLKRGAYRAKPVRRVYIPKPDGTKRPLGVTALEDKIVQRTTVEVLNAIYEVDFKGFSYGFRPGRSQHQALDALYVAIKTKKVNWILDADIRDFFGSINLENLIKFIEMRIADKRIVRLIQKWLNAGVLEDGDVEYAEEGTPQGASISPLLANVYLHYVYDQWIQEWRKTQAKGEMIVVRFADDTIAGFQRQTDAEQFLTDLTERLQKYGLELHPDKTRLIEFGRFAATDRKKRGEGKPQTFTFLGFTHICSENRNGKFEIQRKTIGKKVRAKLSEIKAELKTRINQSIGEVGAWLKSVVSGHYQYYGVPGNKRSLSNFREQVTLAWFRMLRRRSQKSNTTWARMSVHLRRWIPVPQISHPYPDARFTRYHLGKSRVR
jgi:RNA-directed DNA polymerase